MQATTWKKAAKKRINRYIVGCKSDRLDDLFGKYKRINRYIVGCK